MLLSAVLAISPVRPIRLRGHYGRAVQSWLLEQVDRFDKAKAEAIHKGDGQKPFTVSTIIVPGAGRRGAEGETHLIAGQQVLLRITSLDPDLTEIILNDFLNDPPSQISLQHQVFKFHGPMTDSQWWGAGDFSDIVSQARDNPFSSARLHFASPTAFRSGDVYLPLPTPDQVWRSLWWRWNAFAPPDWQIDPLWPDFAQACMVVSDFTLRSMTAPTKGGTATGSTGKVTYRMLDEQHCEEEFRPYRAGAEVILHSLAEFALYSGVGSHTTIGLGQARLLPITPSENSSDDFD